jgi:Tol biopolymer transport system component
VTVRRVVVFLSCLLVALGAASSQASTSGSKGSVAEPAPLVVVGFSGKCVCRPREITPENANDLFLLATSGKLGRRLTRTRQEESGPAWSPDGRSIAYTRADRDCSMGYCRFWRIDIWVIDVASGAARRITYDADMGGEVAPDESLSWSPDGQQLLFIRSGLERQNGIYVVGEDGRGEHLLLGGYFTAADWSPGGAQIAYITGSNGGPVVVLDLGSQRSTPLSVKGLRNAEDVAWSPDGRTLAVEATTGIFVVPSSGGTARLIAKGKIGVAKMNGIIYSGPTWAPTGRRLALRRDVDTGLSPLLRSDIYIVGSDGRRLKKITSGPRHYGEPDWRPER